MLVGGGVKLELILSLLKTFTMLDSSNPSLMCIVCSIHIHMNSPRTFKCYIYCFVLQSLLLPPLLLSSHYSCFLRGLCNPASPLPIKTQQSIHLSTFQIIALNWKSVNLSL